MEATIVITGLSRSPKIALIPLEYFLAVCFTTMMPMMFLDMISWLLTAPLWWLFAWITTRVNPNAHILVMVLFRKTRSALFLPRRSRRYAA